MGIFWQKWVKSCTAGIGLGTGFVLLIITLTEIYAPFTFSKGWQEAVCLFAIYLGSGLLHGFFIAIPQMNLLRLRYTRLSTKGWIFNTIFVCVLLWVGIALLRLLMDDIYSQFMVLNRFTIFGIGILTGTGIGLVFGISQYATIRKHAIHAYRWIVANLLAGLLSGVILSLPLMLHIFDLSTAVIITSLLFALLLMGFTVSSVTGYYIEERLSPKIS
jgi:hypothetical protein